MSAKHPIVKLPVMYFDQRDNWGQEHRTCNTSACWMAGFYMDTTLWKRTGEDKNSDHNFYLPRVEEFGDTTDHGAQTKALAKLGIQSEWRTTLTIENVKDELDEGRPVVMGVLHRGPVSAPSGGGHMICAAGYTATGLIIHDPYGEMDLIHGGYPYGSSSSGVFRHYSYRNLRPRFEVEGAGTGWGRLFSGSRK